MKKVLFIIAFLLLAGCSSSGKYDDFAKCLTQNKVTMYGAFWCPHCQAQKKEFGSSFKYVDYTECSLPDGKSQTEICIVKNITGYPTWEFKDGSRIDGQTSFAVLSDKTGCEVPK